MVSGSAPSILTAIKKPHALHRKPTHLGTTSGNRTRNPGPPRHSARRTRPIGHERGRGTGGFRGRGVELRPVRRFPGDRYPGARQLSYLMRLAHLVADTLLTP